MLVAVDKFTKWIEAKPIKNLDSTTAISFIKELIFIYGIPHSIITDNGSNLTLMSLRRFVLPKALGSTTRLLHTHSRMGKQNGRMI